MKEKQADENRKQTYSLIGYFFSFSFRHKRSRPFPFCLVKIEFVIDRNVYKECFSSI